ncbi:CU044_2847 family protein [Streptomyces sp. NBC_00448]|uniref:CU044_2847 family protein n=1 Tax=Streptomyces sp. NBC_00448 TaxID=2903652 RepID=UPI002E23224E
MTSRLLPLRVGDVDLLVETVTVAGSEPTSRLRNASGRVVDAFDHARDAIVEIASATGEAIGRLTHEATRPEQVEVEFGLKFSTQGTIVVAGVSGEASLVVRLKYPAPRGEQDGTAADRAD